MIFNAELMTIYYIDQQTYGVSWRNDGWLMSNHHDLRAGNGKQFHNKSVPKNQAMKNFISHNYSEKG